MTTVAILGCGYVGIELGRRLRATDEVDRVIGVRRSASGVAAMKEAGIETVQGDLANEKTLSGLPGVDTLVFSASSGKGGAGGARQTYVEGQQTVLEQFGSRENPPDRYVYTSSTGVYGDHDGEWVDETTPLDPATERQQVLVDAETTALERSREYGIDGTVVRFAGLYGPGRYRIDSYLDGPVTDGVLNLTHRDDAAGAVEFLVRTDVARDEVVLVVDDEPVSKWDLADWLAAKCDRPEPPKQTILDRLDDESLSSGARRRIESNKRCRNDKLHSLGYEFEFPTFREGYQRAIEEREQS